MTCHIIFILIKPIGDLSCSVWKHLQSSCLSVSSHSSPSLIALFTSHDWYHTILETIAMVLNWKAFRVHAKTDGSTHFLATFETVEKSVSYCWCGTASQHLLQSGKKGGAAGAREERLQSMSQGWDRDALDDLMVRGAKQSCGMRFSHAALPITMTAYT